MHVAPSTSRECGLVWRWKERLRAPRTPAPAITQEYIFYSTPFPCLLTVVGRGNAGGGAPGTSCTKILVKEREIK